MLDWLRFARDTVVWVWHRHYHVPRAMYLLSGVVGGVMALTAEGGEGLWVCLLLLALGIQGLLRWTVEARPPAAVVVGRFAGEWARGTAVQNEVVTALQDRLGPETRFRVLSVPVVVGRHQRAFAARLRKRLGALFLVYGDVRARGDGESVYARLVRPTYRYVEHVDWFTRDRTPQRTVWEEVVDKLTPAREIDDVEYPYGFANETEAVVRSVEGHLWILVGRPDRADWAVRQALEIAGPSESEAVDEIRVLLAKAMWAHGHHAETVDMLRERARDDTASPELLRTLSGFLVHAENPPPERRRESIDLLRRAANALGDPLRDMTLYNLAQQRAMMPSGEDEAIDLFRDLLRTRESHYSRAWYVFRMVGSWHWTRAVDHHAAGRLDEARAEAQEAAHWYGRAVRTRPKRQIRWDRLAWQFRIRRIEPRPKMIANTADAHELAGNRWRAKYYFWREARIRRRFARRAGRAMRSREWDKAYAYFDWAYVGAGDAMDVIASLSASVAADQRDDAVNAEEQWGRAVTHADPALAASIRDQLRHDLDLDPAA